MCFPAKSHNLHPSIHCMNLFGVCLYLNLVWPRIWIPLVVPQTYIGTYTHTPTLCKINSKRTTQNKRKIVFTNKADTSVMWDKRRGTVPLLITYSAFLPTAYYSHQTYARHLIFAFLISTMFSFSILISNGDVVSYVCKRMKWMWLKTAISSPNWWTGSEAAIRHHFCAGIIMLVFMFVLACVCMWRYRRRFTHIFVCLFGL